jgi:hypothetical protein
LLAKLVGDDKNCKWIYRLPANPGMPRGGVLPPTQSWHWVTNATSEGPNSKIHTIKHTIMASAIGSI